MGITNGSNKSTNLFKINIIAFQPYIVAFHDPSGLDNRDLHLHSTLDDALACEEVQLTSLTLYFAPPCSSAIKWVTLSVK